MSASGSPWTCPVFLVIFQLSVRKLLESQRNQSLRLVRNRSDVRFAKRYAEGATTATSSIAALGQVLPFSNDRSQPLNLVPMLPQVFANELELLDEGCRTISSAVVGRQSDLNLPIVLKRLIGSFFLELAVRAAH